MYNDDDDDGNNNNDHNHNQYHNSHKCFSLFIQLQASLPASYQVY